MEKDGYTFFTSLKLLFFTCLYNVEYFECLHVLQSIRTV